MTTTTVPYNNDLITKRVNTPKGTGTIVGIDSRPFISQPEGEWVWVKLDDSGHWKAFLYSKVELL